MWVSDRTNRLPSALLQKQPKAPSLTAFAREKCFRKHAAFIVANDARQALESKANCIQLVSLTSAIPFGPADKFACAQFILTEAAKQLSGNAGGTAAPSEK